MHAEVLAIGSELLLGEIVDTNSSTLAKKLRTIGMPLHYASTVGDNPDRIVAAIRQGMGRSDLLITTGGLGPTVDDLTRQAVAAAVDSPLFLDSELLAQIEARFRRMGRTMTDNNRQQAYRPGNSIAIENPVGTAPSFIVERQDRILICLPGVPREMEFLMDHSVLPFLKRRYELNGVIKSRELKVAGVGESLVDERVGDLEKLENPAVGLNAHAGVIVVRLTATAANEQEADEMLAPVETIARERLGQWIFGTDEETLESVVMERLFLRGERLAVLESGTGGRLSGKLADADFGRGAFAGGRVLASLEEGADPIALARLSAQEALADWGLACSLAKSGDDTSLEIGLWSSSYAEQWRRGFGSHPKLASEWSSNLALDYLRKALFANAGE